MNSDLEGRQYGQMPEPPPSGTPQPVASYLSNVSEEQVRLIRMAGQVRVLGILFTLLGGLLGLLFTIMFFYVLHLATTHDTPQSDPATLVGAIAVALALLGVTALQLSAGLGLLHLKPWARRLTLVLGCLGLINFPLGTFLGVFTLYVLFRQRSKPDYLALCAAGPRGQS